MRGMNEGFAISSAGLFANYLLRTFALRSTANYYLNASFSISIPKYTPSKNAYATKFPTDIATVAVFPTVPHHALLRQTNLLVRLSYYASNDSLSPLILRIKDMYSPNGLWRGIGLFVRSRWVWGSGNIGEVRMVLGREVARW